MPMPSPVFLTGQNLAFDEASETVATRLTEHARTMEQGVFQVADVKVTARAVFDATSRFHHPGHAEEWSDPGTPARIEAVLALLLKGLEAPRKR